MIIKYKRKLAQRKFNKIPNQPTDYVLTTIKISQRKKDGNKKGVYI